MRISASGGTPELVAEVEGFPNQVLPDGKTILCTLSPPPYRIGVQSLKTGDRKELLQGDNPRYLPTGHIVYAGGNNLFAVAFDPDKLEMTGSPVRVIEGVSRPRGAVSLPLYAVSDSGTLVYVPETTAPARLPQYELVWVDRNGKEEPLGAPPNMYGSPRISPDGTRVALNVVSGQDIRTRVGHSWIWDLVRKTLTRLTVDEATDGDPLWTPDGNRITFFSNRSDEAGEESNSTLWRSDLSRIFLKAADGTGKDELLGSKGIGFPASWSRDGKTLVLTTPNDIVALSMEKGREYKRLLHEKHREAQPRISPDGRWMAYTSNESGRNEIYVRPFPEVEEGRWQVSTSGGDSPLWSPDSRELFYRNGDAIIAVSVKTDPVFSLGVPKVLFQGNYISYFDKQSIVLEFNPWDVSPDGKRFLMMKLQRAGDDRYAAMEELAPRKIIIVTNWFQELKRLVPAQ